MGAMLLVRSALQDAAETLERGKASMIKQGFAEPVVLSFAEFSLALFEKQLGVCDNLYQLENGDFCACTGTFIYRNSIGKPALSRFYQDLVSNRIDDTKIYGSYCIIVYRDGTLSIGIDALETYKLYEAHGGDVIASSFLAGLTTLSEWTVNRQALYEYVYQGASYGADTVANEIGRVSRIRLDSVDWLEKIDHPILTSPATPAQDGLDESVARTHESLSEQFNAIANCFGDDINTGLSGGYDSRLTLALLIEQGVTPYLHVYGRSQDSDVKIARNIAEGERLQLNHVDKSEMADVSVDEVPQIIEDNFYRFDGLPVDGIVDSGADFRTRELRCNSGALMLNGGGGEIFRNFFYLPNRKISVQTLLSVFYSQYDPRAARKPFSNEDYRRRLADKIRKSIGAHSNCLTRQEADSVFPKFRCRYWMGMNNSMNNRLSYSLTPFIDHEIVREASTIPVASKDGGMFEAMLIRRVNERLAEYPSSYGFDFMSGPGTWRRMIEKATYYKPAWLRRNAFVIKSYLSHAEHTPLLAADVASRVFPGGIDFLGEFFDVQRITDNGQLNRILTLNYLMCQYPPSN